MMIYIYIYYAVMNDSSLSLPKQILAGLLQT